MGLSADFLHAVKEQVSGGRLKPRSDEPSRHNLAESEQERQLTAEDVCQLHAKQEHPGSQELVLGLHRAYRG